MNDGGISVQELSVVVTGILNESATATYGCKSNESNRNQGKIN